jgi:putative transposase
MIDDAIDELTAEIGVTAACKAVGRPRSSHHTRTRPPTYGPPAPPRSRKGQTQPRALSSAERDAVLSVLHSERFVDMVPLAVYATLLDEGTYLCSASTMHRLLKEEGESGERRRQATHPAKVKPELVAFKPNQVWSWDITKLLGPVKWTYYYLYTIIDIYSRYVPGWLLAPREDARLAEQLIADTCFNQNIDRGQLSLHADRGSSMTSKTVAFLLADLGVTKSHSRPHTSNDNPFSESQFKTMKYRPDFPATFDSIVHARRHSRDFFGWYNNAHRHSGIALMSPADVHYGRAPAITAARGVVLDTAYDRHPERFVRHAPIPPRLADASWINRRADDPDCTEEMAH